MAKSLWNNIITALKGFAMGAGNIIPGCSAGTIALLTGVFAPVVNALDSATKASTWKLLLKGDVKGFWKAIDGTFLLWLLAGAAVSVFALAKLATWALGNHPVQAWAFSFGLIAATTVYLLAGFKDLKTKDLIPLVIGVGCGIAFSLLTPTTTPHTLWMVFIAGAIGVCAMILPGLSGSLVLVLLGQYTYIMEALDITHLGWSVLIVFALGCGIGLVAFSKLLHLLLERHERGTILLLTGFVTGSLVKVWPWFDRAAIEAVNIAKGTPGALHIGGAVLWCLIGAAIVIVLETLARRKTR